MTINKWPFMVIFLYNLYIFGINLWTMLYPKPCYNEPCYKEVNVYFVNGQWSPWSDFVVAQTDLGIRFACLNWGSTPQSTIALSWHDICMYMLWWEIALFICVSSLQYHVPGMMTGYYQSSTYCIIPRAPVLALYLMLSAKR